MSKMLQGDPLAAGGDPLLSHGELILELILASLAGETREVQPLPLKQPWRARGAWNER